MASVLVLGHDIFTSSITSILAGALLYATITDMLEKVGLPGESQYGHEFPQIEGGINSSGRAEQASRGRITHFGIKLRGPARKYFSHCG